jgi:hypothetical protein
MKKFSRGDGLERELRAARPEPRKEFLRAVESRISREGGRQRAGSFRLGLAGAVTAAMVISLAAFGGLGYAATGVGNAVKTAVHVVAPAKKATPSSPATSARAQYFVEVCYKGKTLRIDSHAEKALLANGATPGACNGGAFTPPAKQTRMCFKGNNILVATKDVKALKKAGLKTGFCKK